MHKNKNVKQEAQQKCCLKMTAAISIICPNLESTER